MKTESILDRRSQRMAIVRSPTGEGKHQYVYGAVDDDGNIMFGEGFKCTRLSAGSYEVKFEQPFVKQPGVVCTILGQTWKTVDLSIAIARIDMKKFICFTTTPELPFDCAFTFMAFGDIE
ncbi:MAG: hypothetical protein GDA43_09115 [Hormoscilla sp. SP5CHS1]|nr:hypothetical protein [Hormoscilla sp. SP5CHS1]